MLDIVIIVHRRFKSKQYFVIYTFAVTVRHIRCPLRKIKENINADGMNTFSICKNIL